MCREVCPQNPVNPLRLPVASQASLMRASCPGGPQALPVCHTGLPLEGGAPAACSVVFHVKIIQAEMCVLFAVQEGSTERLRAHDVFLCLWEGWGQGRQLQAGTGALMCWGWESGRGFGGRVWLSEGRAGAGKTQPGQGRQGKPMQETCL